MIHNKFRYLLTLVALLAISTGAWAQEEVLLTTVTPTSITTYSQSPDGIVTVTLDNITAYSSTYGWIGGGSVTVEAPQGYTITRCVFRQNAKTPVVDDHAPFTATIDNNHGDYYVYAETTTGQAKTNGMDGITSIEVYGTAEPPIEVIPVAEPAANTKQWTFAMPGYDVVLTPVYAAATIYDGETEKQAYETLEEAIANVQDGETIKLDWDVTSDGDIETPLAEDNNPVHFTLDLNGHSININQYFLVKNYVATFTDSSEGQTGRFTCEGFQGAGAACAYYFDSGTYFFHGPAAYYNEFFANPEYRYYLTEGKEFVDVEKVYDGYYLRVAWKTFELTIGKDRFATFYANHNVALDAETPEDVELYTITLIEEDPETGEPAKAYLDQLTGVVEKETPMLVYNGTDAQQTVKIKVTPDEADAVDVAPEFKGTAIDKEFTAADMAAADYYALSGGKLFVPVLDPGTLGANQCWLQFNLAAGAPARGITLVFEKEEATEVTEVSEVNEAGDGAWYDLSGRKLDGEPTTKGVYVKDGKKVVVR